MKNIIVIFCFYVSAFATAENSSYGNRLENLPNPIVAKLAEHVAPNEEGAMGRNRRKYFHVRFQLGMHQLANYGIAEKKPRALKLFLDAAEYSYRYQNDDGGFDISIPSKLKGLGTPSQSEEASGVAFFASSLGSGLYALETSSWVGTSEELGVLRDRVANLKKKFPLTLSYLINHQHQLKMADEKAPNRLLFNGVAFYTLGKILENDQALEIASKFIFSATSQVHKEGYFIEHNGYDSSYNGVAVALGYRLLLMGYAKDDLESICERAISWQLSRITATGEIKTNGNSRVNPSEGGESFLGRTKDVDVSHSIEALLLASLYTGDDIYEEMAENVFEFYTQ